VRLFEEKEREEERKRKNGPTGPGLMGNWGRARLKHSCSLFGNIHYSLYCKESYPKLY
jgi:hypothetical protein